VQNRPRNAREHAARGAAIEHPCDVLGRTTLGSHPWHEVGTLEGLERELWPVPRRSQYGPEGAETVVALIASSNLFEHEGLDALALTGASVLNRTPFDVRRRRQHEHAASRDASEAHHWFERVHAEVGAHGHGVGA